MVENTGAVHSYRALKSRLMLPKRFQFVGHIDILVLFSKYHGKKWFYATILTRNNFTGLYFKGAIEFSRIFLFNIGK
jgi:hypothetical protein